jgi:GMP synthase (glutamine-hydrolysing)
MIIKEIPAKKLNPKKFIDEQVKAIQEAVGSNAAINALSGGVDSSAVTMIGHKALGDKLKTYFVNNGLMREGEPERVVALFHKLKVPVIMQPIPIIPMER